MKHLKTFENIDFNQINDINDDCKKYFLLLWGKYSLSDVYITYKNKNEIELFAKIELKYLSKLLEIIDILKKLDIEYNYDSRLENFFINFPSIEKENEFVIEMKILFDTKKYNI